MDFWEVIKKRHSVRNFLSQPVEKERIIEILEAARLAPSWQNRQCWRFIVVTDKEKIKKIGKLNPLNYNINFFLQNVPVIIVACANPKESGRRAGIEYYLVDTAIAMEHLILAATNLGLATCWIGAFDENMIKDVLKIPQEIRIVALTPLGYACEKPSVVDRISKIVARGGTRKRLEEIAYFNSWGEKLI
ncbi:MAG: nitroreductase family protein [candidate division WOR-3 bacterium]|nr:nitroreductase family protein [candidate division WOR-3 bacterium]MCX7757134.1 nitroreductase family protein [candidate division WOR-3 bacterium]MDW7987800.1 nitroreductase family protein [candidate division WOR-3 bacterium]